MKLSKINNFDLIRFLAALQVLVYHSFVHFGLKNSFPNFIKAISLFPGVPIFFTISGFLISYSLERNNFNLKQYFKNRALRIYPGLWICTIFTAFLLLFFKINTNFKDLALWFLAQISFFQFYTSPSLKQWGVGHPNGSLWSIAVELQFYLVLPIILYSLRFKNKFFKSNFWIAIYFLLSLFLKYNFQNHTWFNHNTLANKLIGNTIFYHLHFFFIGIFIYKNFEQLKSWIIGKAGWWLLIYLAYSLIFNFKLNFYYSPYDIQFWGILANVILSILTISLAFTYKSLSGKILKNTDISYGLYIYHMPITNTLLTIGYNGKLFNVCMVFVLTTLLALFSWFFIEKPIMKLKQ